ncbi:MAG: glycoside hydrolase N-terminal domain-containing protein, partial [Armatimonadetes bacterium]|nr:glycoside hydrolase N-terminal domain-containing protein [Armatimonadota bacterium]
MDWQAYLGQFDIVYRQRSPVWADGLPLGNGSLGALAYEPFHPEWVINKNDVWDYRHPTFRRHTPEEMRRIADEGLDYAQAMADENLSGSGLYPCPKTCGQLRIRFGQASIFAPGHRITKRLDLHQATLHTDLDRHLSHPRIASFICAERNVMVVSVRHVSAMTAFTNHVDLTRTPDAQMPPCEPAAEGDTLWLDQPFHDGFRFVLMARVVPTRAEPDYAALFRETVQERWWPVIEPSGEVAGRVEGQYAVA